MGTVIRHSGIRVSVTLITLVGLLVSITTVASVAALPASAAVGTPVILNEPIISELAANGATIPSLQTDTGNWQNLDNAPATFSYEWLKCDDAGSGCAPVASEWSQCYPKRLGDNAATIRVRVTARNTAGSTTATSAPWHPSANIAAPTAWAPTAMISRASVDSTGAGFDHGAILGAIGGDNGRAIWAKLGGSLGAIGRDQSTGTTTSAPDAYDGVDLSDDGRYLVSGFGKNATETFVDDLRCGATTLISRNPLTGDLGDSAWMHGRTPRISNDGRFVTFVSDATNFVSPKTPLANVKVYLFDRKYSVMKVASRNGATIADGTNDSPDVGSTGDHAWVSYYSDSTNLPWDYLGDGTHKGLVTRSQGAVYVYDNVSGASKIASDLAVQSENSFFRLNDRRSPVSDDGNFVAFTISGEWPLGDDSYPPHGVSSFVSHGQGSRVFLRDFAGGESAKVTPTASNHQEDGHHLAMSGDGRYLAFSSMFLSGSSGCNTFMWDRVVNFWWAIGKTPSAEEVPPAQCPIFDPSMSADGKHVAFVTWGALLPSDVNGNEDVYVYNRDLDPDYKFNCLGDLDCDGLDDATEAQLGTSKTSPDTDGDGLKDSWEVDPSVQGAGFDLDGDKVIDATRDQVFGPYKGDLVAGTGSPDSEGRIAPQWADLVRRPNPLHKDVYLELDWSDCILGGCPALAGGVFQQFVDPMQHAPDLDALRDVVAMFSSAPVTNPDKQSGVNLHVLVDERIHHMPVCDRDASAARSMHFGTPFQRRNPKIIAAKNVAFRYVWDGHSVKRDDQPDTCPSPSVLELMETGGGKAPQADYDFASFGDVNLKGNDILLTPGILWTCSNRAGDEIPFRPNGKGTCFRLDEDPTPLDLGIYPTYTDFGGQKGVLRYPVSWMLGVGPTVGLRMVWGRSFAHLLGHALGVVDETQNDPMALAPLGPTGQRIFGPPDSYPSWDDLQYAPGKGGSAHDEAWVDASFNPYFALAQEDPDADGVPTVNDNCPWTANPDQADLNILGDPAGEFTHFGDYCDRDIDGDGKLNPIGPPGTAADPSIPPNLADPYPYDTDNDGRDNPVDGDDDNDGVPDTTDNCALVANADQANLDGDVYGNACDLDADGDGQPDRIEIPTGSNPLDPLAKEEFLGLGLTCSDGVDNDRDGKVDGLDPGCVDSDGDTAPDQVDSCPTLVGFGGCAISGKVTDVAGLPLANVTARVTRNGRVLNSTFTAADGTYAFKALAPASDYHVQFVGPNANYRTEWFSNDNAGQGQAIDVGTWVSPRADAVLESSLSYAQTVSANQPAGYWRFEETSGTTAADASGKGHVGTYRFGVTLGIPGATPSGKSVAFDGVDDDVKIDDAAELRNNGSFSVEFWAKNNATAAPTQDKVILEKGFDICLCGGYRVVQQATTNRVVYKRDGKSFSTSVDGALTAQWRHFMVTSDGTNVKWYVDGVLDSSQAGGFVTNTNINPVRFAQNPYAKIGLDEVAIFNTALSATDALVHFGAAIGYGAAVKADGPAAYWRLGESTGATASDASGHGLSGSYRFGTKLGVDGAVNYDRAASFDGVDDDVMVADSANLRLNGSFAIEFWARNDAGVAPLADKTVLEKGFAICVCGGFRVVQQAATNKLVFKRDSVSFATTAAGALDDQWHHYALTYDGTNLRWYVDGNLNVAGAATLTTNTNTNPVRLAQNPYNKISLDEVAFYNRILVGTEVKQHFLLR